MVSRCRGSAFSLAKVGCLPSPASDIFFSSNRSIPNAFHLCATTSFSGVKGGRERRVGNDAFQFVIQLLNSCCQRIVLRNQLLNFLLMRGLVVFRFFHPQIMARDDSIELLDLLLQALVVGNAFFVSAPQLFAKTFSGVLPFTSSRVFRRSMLPPFLRTSQKPIRLRFGRGLRLRGVVHWGCSWRCDPFVGWGEDARSLNDFLPVCQALLRAPLPFHFPHRPVRAPWAAVSVR